MKLRVVVENETFDVEVGDVNTCPVQVTVNGESYEVFTEQEQAAVSPAITPVAAPVAAPRVSAAPAAPAAAPAAGGAAVNAPLPGTIVSVLVKPGDKVKAGQEVVVLEAMKMKNSIRASRAGTIGEVLVEKGVSVKYGQPLVTYAD
jgi:glutaconyl-CoA/methylmalonyl-CoA decarboxylase subunit gamma